ATASCSALGTFPPTRRTPTTAALTLSFCPTARSPRVGFFDTPIPRPARSWPPRSGNTRTLLFPGRQGGLFLRAIELPLSLHSSPRRPIGAVWRGPERAD